MEYKPVIEAVVIFILAAAVAVYFGNPATSRELGEMIAGPVVLAGIVYLLSTQELKKKKEAGE